MFVCLSNYCLSTCVRLCACVPKPSRHVIRYTLNLPGRNTQSRFLSAIPVQRQCHDTRGDNEELKQHKLVSHEVFRVLVLYRILRRTRTLSSLELLSASAALEVVSNHVNNYLGITSYLSTSQATARSTAPAQRGTAWCFTILDKTISIPYRTR